MHCCECRREILLDQDFILINLYAFCMNCIDKYTETLTEDNDMVGWYDWYNEEREKKRGLEVLED